MNIMEITGIGLIAVALSLLTVWPIGLLVIGTYLFASAVIAQLFGEDRS